MPKEQYFSDIVADQSYAAMLDGRMFRFYHKGSLTSPGTKEFLFLMPTEKTLIFHGRDFSSAIASADLEVFVNPIFSSEGTPYTKTFNLNGNSANTHEAQVWEDPVITNSGMLSDVDAAYGAAGFSNSGSAGSNTTREFPRIMPSSLYILARITHIQDSADPAEVIYKLFWEEV